MPVPPNQTPATALVIGLDYSYTLPDVDLATPNLCEVWWAYTAVAGDVVVGFWAYDVGLVASYTPTTTVWTGPDPGTLTQIMDGNSATDVPCQFSVTPGESYYLRVRNSSGMAPAAGTSLAVSALRGPALTAPAGSILINDANNDGNLPAALLDATTGEVLQFKNNIAAGEAGAVLGGPQVVALDDADSEEIRVYNSTLTEIAALSFPYYSDLTLPYIAPGASGQFYVSNGGDPPRTSEVATLSSAGVWTLVTWDLGTDAVAAICPNNAETILYFVRQGTGLGAIERYDLINEVPLSDLAAVVAGGYRTYDICVLPDDTILASYVDISPNDFQVRRYSTAGALLNTYPFGAAGTVTPPRICLASDGVSFWAMFLDSTDAANQFVWRVRVSDGVIVDTLDTVVFNRGVYQGTSAADNPRFGHSNSCPPLSPPWDVPGSGSPTPTPPGPEGEATAFRHISPFRRRQRVFPHLSEEQIYAFHKALQIDMETGVGLGDPDDPEAYNPLIMLDWSDDGGHTWSNVHNKTLGKMGEYRHRVMYRMLGRSRDRIYRLTLSDPVRAYVIAGYLDAEAGVS